MCYSCNTVCCRCKELAFQSELEAELFVVRSFVSWL